MELWRPAGLRTMGEENGAERSAGPPRFLAARGRPAQHPATRMALCRQRPVGRTVAEEQIGERPFIRSSSLTQFRNQNFLPDLDAPGINAIFGDDRFN